MNHPTPNTMRDGYPRPGLRRESCLILNGVWQFALTDRGEAAPEHDHDTILVPFCPESKASGLHMPILPRQTMHYRLEFTVDEGFIRSRSLLHFGAVDQFCTVALNGTELGSHEGGYLSFSFDVTGILRIGRNILTVTATDPLDHDLPWGKQKYQRGGMWYTPVSGIWQTVWLESLPAHAIDALRITPDMNSVKIEIDTDAPSVTVAVPEAGIELVTGEKTVTLAIDKPHLWSVEDPHLYDLILTTDTETVTSYFALRRVEIAKDAAGFERVFLNGTPIFLHGLLDQGYFEQGIYTPESETEYERDILRMKALGFNLLRKHIKLEPEAFYYLCDRHGMLVMQDFINTGSYSFLRDTALPTVGLTHIPQWLSPRSKRARAMFLQTACGIQERLYNHPCVIAYTVFNEGWGQFDADRVYAFLKSRDETRLYDATSGWFAKKKSDFDSRHIYFRKLKMKYRGRALLLSEFGGYAYPVKGHTFSGKEYGYKSMQDEMQLQQSLTDLYEKQVAPLIAKGLCGAIYTQVSDVEDEVNGLLTYDREVCKVDETEMKRISTLLQTESKKVDR